ncbi:MAG: transcription-repair coupling factor [Myxococcales bacterium]|nr:transcription-repair coupling factor [Myxococcales bacterium]
MNEQASGVSELAGIARRIAQRSGAVELSGLRGASTAAATAQLVEAQGDAPTLLLVPTAKRADRCIADLKACLGEEPEHTRPRRAGNEASADPGRVLPFPRYDTPPYERFSPQPFVVAQRMEILYRWLSSEAGPNAGAAPIVVAPWTALVPFVPSRERVRARSTHLEVGQRVDRDALVETLLSAGYARMPVVEERGELAVRGGILDLHPPHRTSPVRIELWGDEVESIREFDPVSQRSQRPIAHVAAPPPRELLVDRDLVIERSEVIRSLAESQQIPARNVDALLDELLRGQLPPGVEAIAPLLMRDSASVLDFLPRDTLVVIDDLEAGRARLARYAEEAATNYELARASGRLVLPPAELGLDPEALHGAIAARHPVHLERHPRPEFERLPPDHRFEIESRDHDALRGELERSRREDRPLAPLVRRLEGWRDDGRRCVLSVSASSQAQRLRELLADYGIDARRGTPGRPYWRWSAPGRVEIRRSSLGEGFDLPMEGLVVVGEDAIFGPREKQRRRTRWPEGAAVESLGQLSAGDFLVHADHGIGIYRGLVELETQGISGEFLSIEYAEVTRLFLPVHRLNLVQRYAGSDGHVPRIDTLGGSSWEKAKRRVQRALRDMAASLLSVHAARELAEGFRFSPRDRLLEGFEATFPFEETSDQRAAIEDTLADMQHGKPMDRIVCGDVGYGKTEVALRAAFRAALDGKQVAVLVPTTVLCTQHEETFRQRFEGYPVHIESLSRFRGPAQSRQTLAGLADGSIDVVIGTHRLLQQNVRFRDLGLLVVDEEHRFGVRHKERIKRLKKTVDVLTLTATPIPRTLQLAFTGMRDLSVIETPPADRIAIRTQVCRFSEEITREAILREMRRGGQIFFVHNRVQSIASMAETLGRIVPEATVIVAHGQLPERELESRMLAFMRGEAHVLLCTTIIESGLDIPNANTILINRAESLGLAQLYQLRGRVGRSSQRAYAYLMVGNPEQLSPDARKRMDAIQDLSELGSGFRLANMDLEIRGAGDLLGSEQSGHLAAVGYETYMEMLEKTIDELRGIVHEKEVDPEIRLPVTARLPEDYVDDVNARLVLYKRLASCREPAEIEQIAEEILDRFGPLPEAATNLLEVIQLKVRARRLGVASVDLADGELVLTAAPSSRVDPERLLSLLSQAGSGLRVAPGHKIFATLPGQEAGQLFDAARRLFANLEAK